MAGKSEILDQYARTIRQGPHDQPQSMCPAFGSLRVGLRMRRVATVLSGSACCVYGLTFVSHFYGARRSVGYVPFNSEPWSPASSSRTSATRSTNWPTPTAMTRWW
jgi:3,8-divinyl chlorophyllide a/chlorophyllide a reductase subunit Y